MREKTGSRPIGEPVVELTLVFDALTRIAETGILPPTRAKWDPDFGPIHRVTDNTAHVRTANSPHPQRTFTTADAAKLAAATNRIQRRHSDHAVPSAWGNIDDWVTAGKQVASAELGDGIALPEEVAPVYHATQTVNYQPPATVLPELTTTTQAAIEALTRLSITTKPHYANYYTPSTDTIMIIPKEHFVDATAYIKTYAHELAHATGHPSRLNRHTLTAKVQAGDPLYNQEELVAELASIIVTHNILSHHTRENDTSDTNPATPEWLTVKSAEYLWRHLPEPRGDLAGLQEAIVEAEKAADWILERTLDI